MSTSMSHLPGDIPDLVNLSQTKVQQGDLDREYSPWPTLTEFKLSLVAENESNPNTTAPSAPITTQPLPKPDPSLPNKIRAGTGYTQPSPPDGGNPVERPSESGGGRPGGGGSGAGSGGLKGSGGGGPGGGGPGGGGPGGGGPGEGRPGGGGPQGGMKPQGSVYPPVNRHTENESNDPDEGTDCCPSWCPGWCPSCQCPGWCPGWCLSCWSCFTCQ